MCLHFVPQPAKTVLSSPWGLVTVDVNAGFPDLVVAASGANALEVLKDNGAGAFSQTGTVAVGKGARPTLIAAGDLNGDGKTDLVVVDSGTHSITTYLGDGAGGFNTPHTYKAGADPVAVTLGNVNGDSLPDIVVVNGGTNTVSILTNKGNGLFGAATTVSLGVKAPTSVAVADVNGDGRLDLVATSANTVWVKLNNGSGGFGAATPYKITPASNYTPVATLVADFSGDGKNDILTVGHTGNSSSYYFWDLPNTGGGHFGTAFLAGKFSLPHGVSAITVADIGGVNDIIVASGSTIDVLVNNGAGTLTLGNQITAAGPVTALTVADVNGDGVPDIVASENAGNAVQVFLAAPDSYKWANPYGGSWSTAANWTDVTTGTTATTAPGAANAVSITGNGTNTTINGSGAAAQLTVAGEVLFLGTVAVGGALTLAAESMSLPIYTYLVTDFALDGGANVSAGSLNLGVGATLEVGGGSLLTVGGGALLTGGFLVASDGGMVQLGKLVAGTSFSYSYFTGSTIAVDDASSVEIGTAGGGAQGAVTIDKGQSAAVNGYIFGNVVVNGMLGVQAGGSLEIDSSYASFSDPFGSPTSIGGAGTLVVSEGSTLSLGVADSAAIQFGGPAATLHLGVLSTGTISGFAAGDTIDLSSGLATGLSYTAGATGATLTLREGGKAAGTLTLAGNYSGSVFHLGLDSYGDAVITLRSVGTAPKQPSLILGSAGADNLYASANGQTLTGYGGGDTLDGSGFTNLDFKDTTANLDASTVTSFATADLLDFTDLTAGTASAKYTAGILTVTDGTHTASLTLGFAGGTPATGTFVVADDGAGGTKVSWHG